MNVNRSQHDEVLQEPNSLPLGEDRGGASGARSHPTAEYLPRGKSLGIKNFRDGPPVEYLPQGKPPMLMNFRDGPPEEYLSRGKPQEVYRRNEVAGHNWPERRGMAGRKGMFLNAVRSGDADRLKSGDLSACEAPGSVRKINKSGNAGWMFLNAVRSNDADRFEEMKMTKFDLSACEAPGSVRKRNKSGNADWMFLNAVRSGDADRFEEMKMTKFDLSACGIPESVRKINKVCGRRKVKRAEDEKW